MKLKRRKIEWSFPLPRTHCGIALGNGLAGALVWGSERLNITVNRADFWDRRNGEFIGEQTTFAALKQAYDPLNPASLSAACRPRPDERKKGWFRSTHLPGGRFEFELRAGHKLHSAVLDCLRGMLAITIHSQNGESHCVRIVVSPDKPLLWIEDPGRILVAVHPRPFWEWVGAKNMPEYKPPAVIRRDDFAGWVQPCPADPAFAAFCRRVDCGWLVLLNMGKDEEKVIPESEAMLELAVKRKPGRLTREAARWWRAYWERAPEIELPDSFYQTFFDYALYKFGAATSPKSPLPAGLQGPWIEEYQMTPWGGDYHFNVNVQQIYSLAFPANHCEHLLPLFDMLESPAFRQVMRRHARVLVGIEDGLALTHTTNDVGGAVGGAGGPGAIIDHAACGWTAQLYWLYYRYTMDLEFLRRRAYPFMHGVMRVYEEMLEWRDGKPRLPIGISAEYGQPLPDGQSQHVGPNPSYQISCIHMLIEALTETCRLIGEAPRPVWQAIRDALPPFTTVRAGSEDHIAVWENQDLAICHRHHSHLACIYPFDTLHDLGPEQQAVVESSIDHWILKGMGQWSEWCIPWAAIIEARMGFSEAPLVMLDMWRRLFVNEGLATVYLPRFRGISAHRRQDLVKPRETNEIMQLDGTMGAATAILELLVHERRGVIHVFPAVSERWPDVKFRNAGLPGAFRIDAERRRGRTATVRIHSLKGGSIRVVVTDRDEMQVLQNGKTTAVRCPIALNMTEGETVVFSAP